MSSVELGIESRSSGLRIAKAAAMVAGGVGMIGVAAVGADGYAGYRRWPSTPTRLIGMNPEATHAMLTFSGLGSLSGAEQSDQIQRLVKADTAAHWEYSSSRFSVNELAKILETEAPALKSEDLNGHSMGGPIGLEVARLRGIKLGRVFLHCSPFSIRDTSFAKTSGLMELCRWPTGPGSKYIFSYVRGLLEGLPDRERRERAAYDALNDCSPRMWPLQIRQLRRTDLYRGFDQYKELIGPDTRVDYFMPEDPSRDPTVRTRQACERYGEFFGRLGVPFAAHEVPEAGHADVRKGVEYYLATVGR